MKCLTKYCRTRDRQVTLRCRCMWIPIGLGTCSADRGATEAVIRRGKRLLRHMSCVETFVALSSGEVEYYALIRRACTSLGKPVTSPRLVDVPNTPTATAQQHGVWHADTLKKRHLWQQSRIVLGHMKLVAVAGERNLVEALTTALPGRKIRERSLHVGQTTTAATTTTAVAVSRSIVWSRKSEEQSQVRERSAPSRGAHATQVKLTTMRAKGDAKETRSDASGADLEPQRCW